MKQEKTTKKNPSWDDIDWYKSKTFIRREIIDTKMRAELFARTGSFHLYCLDNKLPNG